MMLRPGHGDVQQPAEFVVLRIAGEIQNPCIGVVRKHKNRMDVQATGFKLRQNGAKIGPFSRTQDGDAKWRHVE